MIAAVAIAAVILAILGFGYWMYRKGGVAKDNQRIKDNLDAVEKRNQADDRLRVDAGLAGRVRARFTRR